QSSATVLSIAPGSCAGVLRRAWARIAPSPSTTPAAILVPPMSTPMASMCGTLLLRVAPDEGRDLFAAPSLSVTRPRPDGRARGRRAHRGRARRPVRPPVGCGNSPPCEQWSRMIERSTTPMFEQSSPELVPTAETDTINTLLRDRIALKGDEPFIEHQSPARGPWTAVTAREFDARVVALAKGLVAHGVEPGDRVGIMSRTRY